ncbi:hypothetical protein OK016_26055 [Vibrio chagasii]|nr:hypothetical protein [Vibrio chagasii]
MRMVIAHIPKDAMGKPCLTCNQRLVDPYGIALTDMLCTYLRTSLPFSPGVNYFNVTVETDFLR